MPDGNSDLFTVTDLKQFMYCQRILYYHTCLPDIRPVTYKMQAGKRRHEDEHKRSLRRTMSLPMIETAQREFDVPVQSLTLGLSGQVDEVIFMPEGMIPVDYKLAKKASPHYKIQLTAYAMMLEETFDLPALKGILYLIQKREAVEINLSRNLRNKVVDAIAQMREIATSEAMPAPCKNRRSCLDCEFRRFCNDV
ncbi:MAG: CRISPR-associated protein Cas4 [Phototrophicaceae bacterium]